MVIAVKSAEGSARQLVLSDTAVKVQISTVIRDKVLSFNNEGFVRTNQACMLGSPV